MRETIVCPFRHRRVALTPEEYVRQSFLKRLVDCFGYPASLISVEKQIRGRRYDALVYSPELKPLVLLEFKREGIALDQKVADQAACYNRTLQVPYLILSNGPQTMVLRVTATNYEYLSAIPEWNQLLN